MPFCFAIKHHKPFIILGERGYGGIPTINNIEQFYSNEFFQGTIGGRLDGALPGKPRVRGRSKYPEYRRTPDRRLLQNPIKHFKDDASAHLRHHSQCR